MRAACQIRDNHSVLLQRLSDERQAAAMETINSLERDRVLGLCELVHTSCSGNLPPAGSRTLGLFRCIRVAVLMLRRNLAQELLADILMVSRATISRVVAVHAPLLVAEVLPSMCARCGRSAPRTRQLAWVSPHRWWVVFMMRRPSGNPVSLQPLMLEVILGTRAMSVWE